MLQANNGIDLTLADGKRTMVEAQPKPTRTLQNALKTGKRGKGERKGEIKEERRAKEGREIEGDGERRADSLMGECAPN